MKYYFMFILLFAVNFISMQGMEKFDFGRKFRHMASRASARSREQYMPPFHQALMVGDLTNAEYMADTVKPDEVDGH